MTNMGIAPAPQAYKAQARMMAGACIGMFLNPAPLVLLSFGVYLLPIVKDTGWDRDFIAGSIGAAMLLIGLSPPLVGWLISRFGPRRVSGICFPLCGLAIMLLGLPTTPVTFVLALAVFGILASGQTAILYVYCLTGWFDRRRGMALGLGLACTGLGIALVPPLSLRAIDAFGWRGTYFALGLAVFLIAIPVSRYLILDPPVTVGKSSHEIAGVAWRQALRSRVFWLLAAAIFLVGAAAGGGMQNLNLMLIERGVSPQSASFILTLLGVSMIAARLVCGALFDRMRGQTLTAMICMTVGIAFLVLALRGDNVGIMIAAVLIGIGFGAEGDALAYMTSRAFGMRDFGTIFGIIFLAFTAGGGVGPMLFAVIRSQTGDYQAAMWIAAAACAVATLLALMIRDSDLPFVAREGHGAATADPLQAAHA